MRQARVWWRGVVVAATVGLVALVTPGPAFAKDGLDLAAVERLVTDFADQGGYPGIAIAITKGDQVVHVGGYGHDSSGAAVTATTPMPVASVSKSFTALAVMQLVEAGKVTLDAPVRDYLPDFRIAAPQGARITVRQLLNQTSGITDRTFPEKSLPQPDSLAGAVVRAHAATLAVQPGTKHFYTNTNYHLAARLVEVVAGEPFAQYLRRQVLEPLGMRASTTIDLTPRDLPDNVRAGHIYAYGAAIALSESTRFVNGSDGIITTAQDMAQWLIVQNNGGKAANGTRLVSPASIKAMHTSSDPRWTYGMGWDTDQEGRVRHNGVWFTYTASQLLLSSGYGIAVIGNSGIGLGNEGTDQLADGLASLLEGAKPSGAAPIRLVIDLILGGLTVVSLFLGVRNLRRTQVWANRLVTRPVWRLALRLLPRLVPLALLVTLPDLLGLLYGGGRDVTYVQLGYYSVALVTWTAVAVAMNLGVLGARTVALLRLRRRTGTTPTPEASAQLVAG
ncbi:serine hydrolase domain-containing protein [Micromonospora arborensis]|uniref:serine hydrolase domain-containing protein n=1 Tax=Micromonospora arborensis TaxID=2116518 RepID=UPI0037129DA7